MSGSRLLLGVVTVLSTVCPKNKRSIMKPIKCLALAAIAVWTCDPTVVVAALTFSEPVLLDAPFNVSSVGTAATTTFNNGLNVIFESDRPGGFGEGDLWEIRRASADAPWSEPVNLGANVNTPYWDAHPTVTSDGLHLVYCDFNPFGDPFRPGGIGTSDLYVASRSSLDEPFGPTSILPTPMNSTTYEALPGISDDGLVLYFTSARAGGSGIADIWVSTRAAVTDPWGDPENLGPAVNSAYYEEGPNISADGLRLLFSSNRPGGVGSWDLWMSSRSATDAPWQPAVHLGSTINSASFDNFPDVSDDFPAVGSVVRFSGSDSPSANARWSVYESIVLSSIPGDYNDDGVVDARDYTVWRDNVGAPANTLPNDPNEGPVGAAQYATWRENYGASAATAEVDNAAVPEPVGVLFMLMGMATSSMARRRT